MTLCSLYYTVSDWGFHLYTEHQGLHLPGNLHALYLYDNVNVCVCVFQCTLNKCVSVFG